jgi:hypothetical protein
MVFCDVLCIRKVCREQQNSRALRSLRNRLLYCLRYRYMTSQTTEPGLMIYMTLFTKHPEQMELVY